MTATVVWLIAKVITTDDAGFERTVETARRVFAEQGSVTGREFYSAIAAGIQTDVMFRVRTADFHAEPELVWHGMRYKVIRAYARTDDWTELTAAVMRPETDPTPRPVPDSEEPEAGE